jgi:FG-GAP repeat protein
MAALVDLHRRGMGWWTAALVASAMVVGASVTAATPSSATGDHGHASVAGPYGDFNGDGYHDLAVGVPYEDVDANGTTYVNAGQVQVIYGSADGLNGDSPIDDQVWHQGVPGVPGTLEPEDYFGLSLAWGDFNGDGYDDLAVGVPYEDHDPQTQVSGAVNVLYGSPSGLTALGSQYLEQGAGGLLDSPEPGDRFGTALAVGNFGNGGRADLAIGVPDEDLPASHGSTIYGAGAVNVVYGSAGGLTATGNQFLTECYLACIPGTPVARDGDHFGSALAAANFGNGSTDDLAVGIPWDDRGSVSDAGGVAVIYGSSGGLTDSGRQYWNAPFGWGDGDLFGLELAAADFGRSSHADLAIGVPGNKLDGVGDNAGSVFVMYGSPTGLGTSEIQYWHKNIPGVPGDASPSDSFGLSLAAANFGRQGLVADLAIASRPADGAGAVTVLYGRIDGLSSGGAQEWSQDTPGIADKAESDDRFGESLAAADFGGSGEADLAIGVLAEDLEVGGIPMAYDVGAVNVIYGSSTGLSAAGSQFWWQRNRTLKGTAEQGDFFGKVLA